MKKKESNLPKIQFADAILNVQKDYGLDQHITIIKPNKLKEKESFVKVFQKALEYAIVSLSPSGCKLFLYFMAKSQYENMLEIDQKVMQERLKISRTSLNKGLNELQELNVIKIMPDINDNRRNTYLINHHVMWKGNPEDRIRSIKNKKEYFSNPYQLSMDLKDKK